MDGTRNCRGQDDILQSVSVQKAPFSRGVDGGSANDMYSGGRERRDPTLRTYVPHSGTFVQARMACGPRALKRTVCGLRVRGGDRSCLRVQ